MRALARGEVLIAAVIAWNALFLLVMGAPHLWSGTPGSTSWTFVLLESLALMLVVLGIVLVLVTTRHGVALLVGSVIAWAGLRIAFSIIAATGIGVGAGLGLFLVLLSLLLGHRRAVGRPWSRGWHRVIEIVVAAFILGSVLQLVVT